MSDNEEVMQVTQKLIQTGYLFENEDTSVLPLRISRNIGPNEAVDLLPTLKKIYQLILNGKSEKAAELLSEMSGLLVAADLGIAREFLIEIEVKKMMPLVLKSLRKELKENITSPSATKE